MYSTLANMKWISVFLILFVINSCKTENQSPICNISNPGNEEEIQQGELLIISASAEDPDGTIAEVAFYIDDIRLGTSGSIPYSIAWNTDNEELGNHIIKAEAKDDVGDITSDEITVYMVHSVPFVTTNQVADITASGAICGGNVTGEGEDVVTARGICWSTVNSPTLVNKHTNDGSGTGEYSSSITELIPKTTYYVRAYATNTFGTGYGQEVEFTSGDLEYGTMQDVDGNSYNTTQIGSQIWMAENLRVTHFADGTPIPLVTDRNEWEKLGDNDTDKAYCWYDNDSLSYSKKYGALYTFAVAVNGTPWDGITDVQGVCPDGWHIPSKSDWFGLESYIKDLGYYFEVGTLLKAKAGWYNFNGDPEGSGTDVFHFGGLPGGQRNWREESAFSDEGIISIWWSSMEDPSSSHTVGQAYGLIFNNPNLANFHEAKSAGLSVRCMKD